MRSTGRSRRLSVTASPDRSDTGELMQEDWEIDLSAASRITEYASSGLVFALRVSSARTNQPLAPITPYKYRSTWYYFIFNLLHLRSTPSSFLSNLPSLFPFALNRTSLCFQWLSSLDDHGVCEWLDPDAVGPPASHFSPRQSARLQGRQRLDSLRP